MVTYDQKYNPREWEFNLVPSPGSLGNVVVGWAVTWWANNKLLDVVWGNLHQYGDTTPVIFAQSPYTVLATDQILVVDTTAGDVVVLLPLASIAIKRDIYIVKTSALNSVFINATGADFINDTTTLELTDNKMSATISSITTTQWSALLNFKTRSFPPIVTTVATATSLPSTAAIIYANGTAWVGATLTRGENWVLGLIDWITVAVGDRILVKDQIITFQNWVYEVTSLGTGGTPYILTRTTDSDQVVDVTIQIVIPTLWSVANTWRSWSQTNSTFAVFWVDALTYEASSAIFWVSKIAGLDVDWTGLPATIGWWRWTGAGMWWAVVIQTSDATTSGTGVQAYTANATFSSANKLSAFSGRVCHNNWWYIYADDAVAGGGAILWTGNTFHVPTNTSVKTVTVAFWGTAGYVTWDTIRIINGNNDCVVTVIAAAGVVTGISGIVSIGSLYTVWWAYATTVVTGAGDGTATLNVTVLNSAILGLISNTNRQYGTDIKLIFDVAYTVNHNTALSGAFLPIYLAGSVPLVAAANTVLGLTYDSIGVWQETFRKVA